MLFIIIKICLIKKMYNLGNIKTIVIVIDSLFDNYKVLFVK